MIGKIERLAELTVCPIKIWYSPKKGKLYMKPIISGLAEEVLFNTKLGEKLGRLSALTGGKVKLVYHLRRGWKLRAGGHTYRTQYLGSLLTSLLRGTSRGSADEG